MAVIESTLHLSYSWMRLIPLVQLVLKAALEVCTTDMLTLLYSQFSCLVFLIIILSDNGPFRLCGNNNFSNISNQICRALYLLHVVAFSALPLLVWCQVRHLTGI